MFCKGTISVLIVFLVHFVKTDSIQMERNAYEKKMLSYMDMTVNPCENFYDYACGNYFKVNKKKTFSKDDGDDGPTVIISETFNKKKILMLQEPIENEDTDHHIEIETSSISAINKAKYFYQSCEKEKIFHPTKISEEYLNLINSMGGCPALNRNWKEENYDWFKAISILNTYGLSSIISEGGYNMENQSISYLVTDYEYWFYAPYKSSHDLKLNPEIDFDHLSKFNREYYFGRELSKEIMKKYGISQKKAISVFDEIITFLKRLHNFYKGITFADDIEEEEMTINELNKYTPNLNWTKFYSTLYEPDELKKVRIRTYDKKFIGKLDIFFKGNNIRSFANYVALKTLLNLHDEIYSYNDKAFYCLDMVQAFMDPVITVSFLESPHFDPDLQYSVGLMFDDIKNVFSDMVKSSKRITKTSMKNAIRNITSCEIRTDNDYNILNMTEFDIYFSALDIKSKYNFYENTLNSLRFLQKQREFDTFENVYDISTIIRLNEEQNQIIAPAGIYQRPFFYPELPEAYNYGAIGTILANQLSRVVKWKFNHKYENEYEKNVECFLEQYTSYNMAADKFEYDKIIEWNLKENIADNEGLRISFYTYQNWLQIMQPSLNRNTISLFNHLNMTDNQLFFLSYAQTSCEKKTDFSSAYYKWPASPGKWRIIGSLSNFDEFSRAFNCSLNSRMNPEQKCVLWQ